MVGVQEQKLQRDERCEVVFLKSEVNGVKVVSQGFVGSEVGAGRLL